MSDSAGRPLRNVIQVAIATGAPVAPGDPPNPPDIAVLCSDSTVWVQDPADPTGWHLLPTVPGTRYGS